MVQHAIAILFYANFCLDWEMGWYVSPQTRQFGKKCGSLAVLRQIFTLQLCTNKAEIWHGGVYHGFTLTHQFMGGVGHPISSAVTVVAAYSF